MGEVTNQTIVIFIFLNGKKTDKTDIKYYKTKHVKDRNVRLFLLHDIFF